MVNSKDSLCDLKQEIEAIVRRLGGPGAVAKRFGISDAAVQQWKVNGLPELRHLQLSLSQPEVFEGTRYEIKAEATKEEA